MPSIRLYAGTYGPLSRLAVFLSAHRYDPNVVIEGTGSGNTFIDIPITLSAWHPRLRNVCVRAPVILENCGSPLLDDVVIHNPAGTRALTIRITPDGIPDGWVSWPRRGEEKRCARATLGTFRDVVVETDGGGWLFEDQVGDALREEWRKQKLSGSFLTAMRMFGGHTSVRQGPGFELVGLKGLDAHSHYVDQREGPALVLRGGTRLVNWFGRDLDPPIVAGEDAAHFNPIGWPKYHVDAIQRVI